MTGNKIHITEEASDHAPQGLAKVLRAMSREGRKKSGPIYLGTLFPRAHFQHAYRQLRSYTMEERPFDFPDIPDFPDDFEEVNH